MTALNKNKKPNFWQLKLSYTPDNTNISTHYKLTELFITRACEIKRQKMPRVNYVMLF